MWVIDWKSWPASPIAPAASFGCSAEPTRLTVASAISSPPLCAASPVNRLARRLATGEFVEQYAVARVKLAVTRIPNVRRQPTVHGVQHPDHGRLHRRSLSNPCGVLGKNVEAAPQTVILRTRLQPNDPIVVA
jgi:hypothetical protein